MYRSHVIAALILAVLIVAGGCARKNIHPDVSSVPPTPVQSAETTDGGQGEPAGSRRAATLHVPGGKLETVFFDYDSYTLKAEAMRTLEDNAKWLQENQEVNVTIEGHCDERGSDEYNLALGERRAKAVKSYLVALGVATDRLGTISYGEEMPASVGRDESAWSKNRRAEFK